MSTRQSVTLPDPLWQYLKQEADRRDIAMSDMIRRALDEWADRRDNELRKEGNRQ